MRLALVFLLLPAFASCTDTRVEDPDPVGLVKKHWDDVPIVQGMKYVLGEGKEIPGNGIRSYRMELKGGIGVKNAVDFYKQSLPAHNWELREERGEPPGAVTLVFWKDKEKLTLDADQESMQTTVVRIKLGPR
jgi:hypothetical protein